MAQREIVRTEAIVIRSLNYGETSQIVTLFTREKGKVAVIAKGARRTKSTFGATLQLMAYTEVVFYYKPGRGLQTLSESAHVESFHALQRSLEKISIGLRVIELIDALLEEEDPQPSVFNLARQTLHRLNATDHRAANLWPFFQLRLASRLGMAPSVRREAVNDVPERGGILDLESGAVLLPDGSPRAGRRASRSALRAYGIFARAALDDVLRMHLALPVRNEVNDLIRSYMRYQFETAYPSTSEEVIGQLMEASRAAPDP